MKTKVLCLGRIQKSRGLRSDIRISTFGELLFSFTKRTIVSLYRSLSLPLDGFLINPIYIKDVHIRTIQSLENIIIAQIDEYSVYDTIQKIKGYYIGIDLKMAQARYTTNENTYLFQYIDLNVYDSNTSNQIEPTGIVDRIETWGIQNYLVIHLIKENKDVLVPLNTPFIESVDFFQKKIYTKDIFSLI